LDNNFTREVSRDAVLGTCVPARAHVGCYSRPNISPNRRYAMYEYFTFYIVYPYVHFSPLFSSPAPPPKPTIYVYHLVTPYIFIHTCTNKYCTIMFAHSFFFMPNHPRPQQPCYCLLFDRQFTCCPTTITTTAFCFASSF
jgi:hypothetical protein